MPPSVVASLSPSEKDAWAELCDMDKAASGEDWDAKRRRAILEEEEQSAHARLQALKGQDESAPPGSGDQETFEEKRGRVDDTSLPVTRPNLDRLGPSAKPFEERLDWFESGTPADWHLQERAVASHGTSDPADVGLTEHLFAAQSSRGHG